MCGFVSHAGHILLWVTGLPRRILLFVHFQWMVATSYPITEWLRIKLSFYSSLLHLIHWLSMVHIKLEKSIFVCLVTIMWSHDRTDSNFLQSVISNWRRINFTSYISDTRRDGLIECQMCGSYFYQLKIKCMKPSYLNYRCGTVRHTVLQISSWMLLRDTWTVPQ